MTHCLARVMRLTSLLPLLPPLLRILGDNYDTNTKRWDWSGGNMIAQQDFWFTLGMTVFILIPWFTVREVKGEAQFYQYTFDVLTMPYSRFGNCEHLFGEHLVMHNELLPPAFTESGRPSF